jgi:voltage-gated potassium channel Kch
MRHISENNNFIYLTAGLVLMLLAGAVVEHFPGTMGPRMVQASTVVVLALGVWGFRTTAVRFRAGAVFVITVLLLVLAGIVIDLSGLRYFHLLVLLFFFIWTAWVAARQVLFTGSIDGNKIVGAICIYLLLGYIWSLGYLFVAEISPQAFNGLEQASWHDNFFDALYFSFVTLTTLGYGDISPAMSVARFLVIMEAVVGMFYMSILVASLVGVRMSAHSSAGR